MTIAGRTEHDRRDVESFYSLSNVDLTQAVCHGTACFVAGNSQSLPLGSLGENEPRVYCLGKCFAAPATGATDVRPAIASHAPFPIVLERIVDGPARTLANYQCRDGLEGLKQAIKLSPYQVISEIEVSELRGRGGAGFPAGKKWRTVANELSSDKFVVANLDEGDPGAYVDRFIAEDDPFNLIEGMVIAAYATGARKGYIYVRCEYPTAIERLTAAIAEARAWGMLGERILGHDFDFDVELVVGSGSYVCGEETLLLNSIEGIRPAARVRPPYVAQCGLKGMPTVVNNVETLANVPWIMRHGGKRFASQGIPGSRRTKVLSLNSLFRRPGLYEVEFGITLRDIVEVIGGGLVRGTLHGLWIGGPLSGVLPPSMLETSLGFQEMHAVGASVGHGGVIAFDEGTSIPDLVRYVFEFGAYESCGQCTPCRLGTSRLAKLLSQKSASLKRNEWDELILALKLASLCAFGTGLAEFADSIQRYYARELERCFE